jgi:hypothetical protein
LFDSIEEPLDPVAGAVEIWAETDRIAAIALGWDVGPCTLLRSKLSDPICVVAAVGKRIDPDGVCFTIRIVRLS